MSSRKKCRDSEYNSINISVSTEENSFALTDLPNEIILLIFEYLTPNELISFTELGNKRLNDLTYSIEHADFSYCFSIDKPKLSSYFSRSRVKLIKRMNFSFVKNLTPGIITAMACKCKNLTELSIIKCQINCNNFLKILQACPVLSKISWDFHEFENDFDLLPIHLFPIVKTFYLLVDVRVQFPLPRSIESISRLLNSFPNVKIAWIYFSDSFSASLFLRPWTKVSCLTNMENTKKALILCSEVEFQFLRLFLRSLFNSLEANSLRDTFLFSPFAQLKSDFKTVSMLSSNSSAMITSFSILITCEFCAESEKLAECLNRVAGIKLKHLCLQAYHNYVLTSSYCPKCDPTEVALNICDFLEKVLLVSTYVTVLNLFSIHFEDASPFRALRELKFLKTIIISSCAFPNEIGTDTSSEAFKFEDIVKACPLVESFTLYFCSISSKLSNASLQPVQAWKELRKLKLYSVSLTSCNFLRQISESCQRLESLSLISFKCGAASYVPDVLYFLKNAKKLKFFQISHEEFNPMYNRFWELISDCQALEGICIHSNFTGYIDGKRILKSLQKLKHLQLFHFKIPGFPFESLYSHVRKLMNNNGVKNFSLHVMNESNENELRSLIYYGLMNQKAMHCHLQPYMHYCALLHFV